jgi:hypothetical protein
MKRSRYNLLPYFIDDERSLAKRRAYVASCRKFFKELSDKQQASSDKLQASSNKILLHKPGTRVKNRFNRKV